MDRAAIQNEINEAYATLRQLRSLFEGREMPMALAEVERSVREQLEAAQALLG